MMTSPGTRGPDSNVLVRAMIAHIFRAMSPISSRQKQEHFIKDIILLIPEARDKCSSTRTLRSYLTDYDRGEYDYFLRMLGVERVALPSDHKKVAVAVNKLVMKKLCEVDIEELRVSGCQIV